ncbi:MAG TPA: hypothetical protein VGF67_05135 [Ktedonobacteraceae bacterium]
MRNVDPAKSKIQLEILKERLKYSEEKFHQQEQALAQAYKNLGQKEAELKQVSVEKEDLRIKWEVLQRDFKYVQDTLAQGNQKTAKKRNTAKLQAFLASLIFLLTSVLVNIGTTMLTSLPPNTLGWVMIALAAAAYIIAALMTTFLAIEGGNP